MRLVRPLFAGFLVLVWLAVPLGAAVAQDDSPVSPAMLARFEDIVESEMAYLHIPGAAVAVIQDGEVVYSQGFGVRSVASGEPFTPQTQFRIGSTTKSMTSLMIARLVDEGVLAWDTPVMDIYPDFRTSVPDLAAQITVRDLMSMGTGLEPDGLISLGWGEWTVPDLFESIAAMSVGGKFRQHYAYNNEVYASAGYIAAIAAGEAPTLDAYKQMMQARLFEPLGMTSTLITDDLGELSANYADSYSFTLIGGIAEPDPVLPAPIHVVAPAGAVWSTVDDMARYVITQMDGGVAPDGTRIVSEESLATTWKPQVYLPAGDTDIENLAYAMGWVTGTYKDVPFRYHDGGWDGYRTQMVIFPDTQTGLIIFANHIFGDMFNYALMYAFAEMLAGRDPAPVLEEVHAAFDESFGSIDAQLAFLPPPQVQPEDVSALLGEYEQGWTVELREDNLLWLARPNWEFLLRPIPGENLYVLASGAALGVLLEFSVDGDQVSVSLELGGETRTFAKTG